MTNFAKKIKLSNHTVYINYRDIVLQSYDAFVARIRNGRFILGPLWDYSSTTWRHIRKFIECYKNELGDRMYKYISILLKSQNGRQLMKVYIDMNIVPVVDNVGLNQGEA